MTKALMPVLACVLLIASALSALTAQPVFADTYFDTGNQNRFDVQRAQQTSLGPIERLLFYVRTKQQELNRELTGAIGQFKREGTFSAIYALLVLSFFYGVFHAAGPGHGKAVISSYLLSNETEVRRGIVLAFLASFVQALSAILLVSVLLLAFDFTSRGTNDVVPYLESASYALISIIGGWLLWRAFRHRSHNHDHAGHDHGGASDHDHAGHHHEHVPLPEMFRDGKSVKELAAIVLAVGIRPCTGAVLVLIFAMAQGIFLAGAAATFAMSIGTAITVSALALLTVLSKSTALKLAGEGSALSGRLHSVLSIGGAAAILVLGITLFAASLGPDNPLI